ncbi:hypothetical protein Y1Q_0010382 [Alligator mississippiensis]|uniref:Uncharacterized protein n=1 Tax=Alligator mississippiensis TaxID=8496 RepID=A0A151MPD4_ALLMI|nr:hypothetical protein Y1Q_0010382 [Alligator mississippiensis]
MAAGREPGRWSQLEAWNAGADCRHSLQRVKGARGQTNAQGQHDIDSQQYYYPHFTNEETEAQKDQHSSPKTQDQLGGPTGLLMCEPISSRRA